jgi:hypothetical protein
VILKLFQESLYDEAVDNRFLEEGDGQAARFIRNEATAYQWLEDLQGSVIPYSYGFFEASGRSFLRWIGRRRTQGKAPG